MMSPVAAVAAAASTEAAARGHAAAAALPDVLANLALILGVAAVMTVLCRLVRQPVVLGYLVAGFVVGPNVPVVATASPELAQVLAELGVTLLMFSIGLEFSLRRLVRVAPGAGLVAIIETSLMLWAGYSAGRLLGWSGYESLFAGGVVAIASTTIVARSLADSRVARDIRELVFGVLVAEDVVAVVLVAALTAVASGAHLSASAVVQTTGRLAAFLIAVIVGGLLVVPRAMRAVARLGSSETTLVAGVGLCFGLALLARQVGYSVALGAFLAGALAAESGAAKRIEPLVAPLRDMFAAIFFVSVGMLIEPRAIATHWPAVLVLAGVVVVGKTVSVLLGAFLTGHSVQTSVQAGLSLAQIGEFSFIIASIGVAQGATGRFLYPVAIAVSVLTTLLAPWLVRSAGRIAGAIDRALPASLQTYASLYGSWVARLRASAPEQRTVWTRLRRLAVLLAVDASCLVGVVIVASRWGVDVGSHMLEGFGLGAGAARVLVLAGAVALSAPFVFGAVRLARALGTGLAQAALPGKERTVDLAAAPRRALLVTIQLGILLLVGAPAVAVVQPFLPPFHAPAALIAALVPLGVVLWRSTKNLEGHVRAGIELLLETLGRSGARGDRSGPIGGPAGAAFDEATRLLPGMGEPRSLTLDATSPGAGKSLRELDLRGRTGALVLAIERDDQSFVLPRGEEVLKPGDRVLLTGPAESVEAARAILGGAA
jgi:CPA2 family monovalent cation:H+ antiporter-2